MIGTFFIINNLGFNPHTRIGCDTGVGEAIHDYLKFQSTHPYRVRRSSDFILKGNVVVSIHAPVEGATVRTRAHDKG